MPARFVSSINFSRETYPVGKCSNGSSSSFIKSFLIMTASASSPLGVSARVTLSTTPDTEECIGADINSGLSAIICPFFTVSPFLTVGAVPLPP